MNLLLVSQSRSYMKSSSKKKPAVRSDIRQAAGFFLSITETFFGSWPLIVCLAFRQAVFASPVSLWPARA